VSADVLDVLIGHRFRVLAEQRARGPWHRRTGC
jgi:hypothetical protein